MLHYTHQRCKVLSDAVGFNEYAVPVATVLSIFASEFLYDRFIVFDKSIDTAVKNK